MGRHAARFAAFVVVAVVAAGCGLRPADEDLPGSANGEGCPEIDRPDPEPLEPGVVQEHPSEGADHVLCAMAYATSPPTSGDHFPAWQNCGFYSEPIRDETAVHSMEHGAIWIAYDPALDAAEIDAIAALVSSSSHYLAAPYPGLQNPIVLSAWTRQVAVDRIGDPAVGAFADAQLGRVSQTAPEAGVTCESPLGVPPFEPDAGYDDLLTQYGG